VQARVTALRRQLINHDRRRHFHANESDLLLLPAHIPRERGLYTSLYKPEYLRFGSDLRNGEPTHPRPCRSLSALAEPPRVDLCEPLREVTLLVVPVAEGAAMIYFMCPRSRARPIKSLTFESETLDRRTMSGFYDDVYRHSGVATTRLNPRGFIVRALATAAIVILVLLPLPPRCFSFRDKIAKINEHDDAEDDDRSRRSSRGKPRCACVIDHGSINNVDGYRNAREQSRPVAQ